MKTKLEMYTVTLQPYSDAERTQPLPPESMEVEYTGGFLGPDAFCRLTAASWMQREFKLRGDVAAFDVVACVPC